ncbi:MAG: peptide/nickel transport system permease protein [Trichococcus sp.]|nr:peptide/nickel transport system permease protein [Trichococcus sp.]
MNTEEEKKAGRVEELKTEIVSVAAGENRLSHEVNEETKTVVDFRGMLEEFRKDKLAVIAFGALVLLLGLVFVGSLFFDTSQVMQVDLLNRYASPGKSHLLGTDEAGRDVLGQLLLGARTSLMAGTAVTVLNGFIGIGLGLLSGYYGGFLDRLLMRSIDFIMVLPASVLVLVLMAIVSEYNLLTFILLMSAFSWAGKSKVFRNRTRLEAKRDYVRASKTAGTNDLLIMVREILPNFSSLVIINTTMSLARNIGMETGLSFLGFGLPPTVPSIGNLLRYAISPTVFENYVWVWLPASTLIFSVLLCIIYVGQALRRAADAKQTQG